MLPIETNTTKCMKNIADFIKQKIGEDYAFTVLVAPYGEGEKTAHYISNIPQEIVIKVLRENADVLESRLDISTNNQEN